MGLFIYDPAIRIATPLSVDLRRRTITELTPSAPLAAIHAQPSQDNQRRTYEQGYKQQTANNVDSSTSRRSIGCAADIMTSNIVSIEGTASWQDARRLLNAHGFHHLIVTNTEGQVTGLLTERDLLDYPDGQCSMSSEGLPTRPLPSATPDTALTAVAFFMIERKTDAIAVISGQSVEGIITHRDFLKAFLNPSLLEAWA